MTTPTFKFRLSPSGKFLGRPALLLGPGSIGRRWRKHGSDLSQGNLPIGTSAPTPITGLDTVPVDMRPGFAYDVELMTYAEGQGLTTSLEWFAYYALHDASASTWGAWVKMTPNPGQSHELRSTTTNPQPQQWAGDMLLGLSVTVTYDAIAFAASANVANGVLFEGLSWVVVTETMP